MSFFKQLSFWGAILGTIHMHPGCAFAIHENDSEELEVDSDETKDTMYYGDTDAVADTDTDTDAETDTDTGTNGDSSTVLEGQLGRLDTSGKNPATDSPGRPGIPIVLYLLRVPREMRRLRTLPTTTRMYSQPRMLLDLALSTGM